VWRAAPRDKVIKAISTHKQHSAARHRHQHTHAAFRLPAAAAGTAPPHPVILAAAPAPLLLLAYLLFRYDSKKYYNFGSPGFSPNAGQFTQV
jgi:hypothetical protein